MPDGYDGGTIVIILHSWNEDVTPTLVQSWDVACQCRGSTDVVNTTFSTPVEMLSGTYDTTDELLYITSAAHTPNGTCAAGDELRCTFTMDAVTSTTEVASVYYDGLRVEYGWGVSD